MPPKKIVKPNIGSKLEKIVLSPANSEVDEFDQSKNIDGFSSTRRRLFITGAFLLIIVAILGAYHLVYAGKIFPGIRVGGIDLSGLTQNEAEVKLQTAWDAFVARGLPVSWEGRRATVTPIVTSPTDPDLTYELVRFNSSAVAKQALAVGREGKIGRRIFDPIVLLFKPNYLSLAVEVNNERLVRFLYDSFPNVEQIAKPASFVVAKDGSLQIVPEENGVVIDIPYLTQAFRARFLSLSTEPVVIKVNNIQPSLTSERVAQILPQAQSLLHNQSLTFVFEDKSWSAEPGIWHTWFEPYEQDSNLKLRFSATLAQKFFDKIISQVEQPAQDAKFEFKDGKVTTFIPSQQGRKIDLAATLVAALAVVEGGSTEVVPLNIAIAEPTFTTADANEFGISEIIGVGKSNFAGSPKNRRINIRTGATKLNGVLIKPDEDFSLIKALGEIDAANGYLQELVIKDNKTIPEFGGGLCQIGTTTFRAALASGLPILERQNHSYRVVYYEPAGTDATIYSPKPDFRFKNDTGSTILIQTKIQGDSLIFEFWGKKDGRQIEQTKPRIFKITAPPPAKLIETEDLKPGEKKCTEKAHAGADTEFTYTVTYPSGTKVEKVFKSHYVPWQEVCLIGVPKGTLQLRTESGTVLGESTTAADSQNKVGN